MPKFRLLTLEELQELEKEFIHYLIVNGITAEDWEKIKKEDVDRADCLIEVFSDMVFEKIMTEVEYLEYRDRYELKTFQCLKEKIVLVGMSAAAHSEVNFKDAEYLKKAVQHPPQHLHIYTTEKKYQKQREVELFDMIQAGCVMADGRLFKTLCLSL